MTRSSAAAGIAAAGRRAGHRQDAHWPRSSATYARCAARRCSGAAATSGRARRLLALGADHPRLRPATRAAGAARRAGPGRGRHRRDRLRGARACRDCRRRRAWTRSRRASGCSTVSPRFLRNAAAASRWCWCWTTCTGRTASLLLLQFLARELGPARLLLSGPTATSRSAAATRWPRRWPNSRAARHRAHAAARPSPRTSSASYRAHGRHRRRRTGRAVHRETEGNPFFVTRSCACWSPRAARERPAGGVVESGSRRACARSSAAGSTGFGGLQRGARVAAVIGREFGLPLLARVSGRPDALLDALEEAVRARLVRRRGAPGATASPTPWCRTRSTAS